MPPKAVKGGGKAAKVIKIPACIVGDLLKVTLRLGEAQTEIVMAKVTSVSGEMVVTVRFVNDFSNKVHVLPTVLTKKVVVVKLKKGSKEKAPLPPPSIIGFEQVLVNGGQVTIQSMESFAWREPPQHIQSVIIDGYTSFVGSVGPAVIRIKLSDWQDVKVDFNSMLFGEQRMKVHNVL